MAWLGWFITQVFLFGVALAFLAGFCFWALSFQPWILWMFLVLAIVSFLGYRATVDA